MKELNRLAEIIKEKNSTYRRLSALTDISYSALHKIATFERSPTQTTMIIISRALGLLVSEVFNLEYL